MPKSGKEQDSKWTSAYGPSVRRLTILVLSLVTAATLAVTGPASAASLSFTDQRGDAPARFDLTRVTVQNTDVWLTVTTRLRDLKAAGTQVFGFTVGPSRGSTTYMVYSVRRPNGRVQNRLDAVANGDLLHLRCRIRARWQPAREVIRVSVPRDCITEGRVRTNAYIGKGDGTAGDPWDWTRSVTVGQG